MLTAVHCPMLGMGLKTISSHFIGLRNVARNRQLDMAMTFLIEKINQDWGFFMAQVLRKYVIK